MKKLWVKIVIPMIIIVLIIGLWFVKNQSETIPENNNKEPVTNIDKPNNEGSANKESSTVEDPLKNADFSLNSNYVDVKELSKYGLPMIIDYGSEGCGPCQYMKPALKAVNEKMYRKAFVKYIDVWEHPESAEGMPVSLIPTQFFWNADGTPFVPSEELGSKILFDLYYDNITNEHVFTAHVSPLTEEEMLEILAEMGVDIND